MRAFSTANGGVMFIPDEIERVQKTVSYIDLVTEAPPEKTSFVSRLFGKRKKDDKPMREAA